MNTTINPLHSCLKKGLRIAKAVCGWGHLVRASVYLGIWFPASPGHCIRFSHPYGVSLHMKTVSLLSPGVLTSARAVFRTKAVSLAYHS